MHSKEIMNEQKVKEILLSEMLNMTSSLKETTIGINQSVKSQNLVSIHSFLCYHSAY